MNNDILNITGRVKHKLELLQLRLGTSLNTISNVSNHSAEDLKNSGVPIRKNQWYEKECFLKTMQSIAPQKVMRNSDDLPSNIKPSFRYPSETHIARSLNRHTEITTDSLIVKECEHEVKKFEELEKKYRRLETMNTHLTQEVKCKNLEVKNLQICLTEEKKQFQSEQDMQNSIIDKLEKEIKQAKKIRDDYLKIIQSQKLDLTKLQEKFGKFQEEFTKKSVSLDIIQSKLKSKTTQIFVLKAQVSSMKTEFQALSKAIRGHFDLSQTFKDFNKMVTKTVNQALSKTTKVYEIKLIKKGLEISSLEELLMNASKEKKQLQDISNNCNFLEKKIKDMEDEQRNLKEKNDKEQEIVLEKLQEEIGKRNAKESCFEIEKEKYLRELKGLLELKEENEEDVKRLSDCVSDLTCKNLEITEKNIEIVKIGLILESKLKCMIEKLNEEVVEDIHNLDKVNKPVTLSLENLSEMINNSQELFKKNVFLLEKFEKLLSIKNSTIVKELNSLKLSNESSQKLIESFESNVKDKTIETSPKSPENKSTPLHLIIEYKSKNSSQIEAENSKLIKDLEIILNEEKILHENRINEIISEFNLIEEGLLREIYELNCEFAKASSETFNVVVHVENSSFCENCTREKRNVLKNFEMEKEEVGILEQMYADLQEKFKREKIDKGDCEDKIIELQRELLKYQEKIEKETYGDKIIELQREIFENREKTVNLIDGKIKIIQEKLNLPKSTTVLRGLSTIDQLDSMISELLSINSMLTISENAPNIKLIPSIPEQNTENYLILQKENLDFLEKIRLLEEENMQLCDEIRELQFQNKDEVFQNKSLISTEIFANQSQHSLFLSNLCNTCKVKFPS